MADRISKILQAKFSRKDNLSKQLEIVKVFDAFREAVATIFAKNQPTPISLQNKILTIQTTSSSQANQLRFSEPKIIKKINSRLKKEIVSRVIYRF